MTKVFSIAYRQSQIFYTKELKRLGVTSGLFMYIVCIHDHPGLTQDELSNHLMIDKGNVAKAVQQLLVGEYITRRTNVDDRRVYNLFPTDKMQAIYPEIILIKEKWHSFLTSHMTDVEKGLFVQLLEKIPFSYE